MYQGAGPDQKHLVGMKVCHSYNSWVAAGLDSFVFQQRLAFACTASSAEAFSTRLVEAEVGSTENNRQSGTLVISLP